MDSVSEIQRFDLISVDQILPRKKSSFLESISEKFKKEVVPFAPNKEELSGKGFYHNGVEYVHHSGLAPSETAFFRLNKFQHILILSMGLFSLLAFIVNWHAFLVLSLFILSILYTIDIFFNLFLISKSFAKYPEIKVSKSEIKGVNGELLPTYTIFCPLYHEWRVLPQFVTAISRLNYPKNKLQVMLLLEEDDRESIEKIKEMKLPEYFEMVIVPDSMPKTKPKACNFGLMKARGEYSVIYDAEDVPERDQLIKAVLAFEKSEKNVVCIQAKLNFYNPHHNTLTRLFTAEYSLWFDLILTGLQAVNAPIPLGGTSNHFKTESLRNLRGWDAFNVTEDCDLGMRLVKGGYRTAVVDSTTHEEANSNFGNWFGQRTRWIKGYIQSYFVHMRNPNEWKNSIKNPQLFMFQLIVGGKVLSMFINPILWLSTVLYFAERTALGPFIQSLFPGPSLYIGFFAAVVGNFLYFYYYMIGCARRGYFELIKFGLLIPFYWLMMSVATWSAIYKIIVEPHYWFKTKHGLHFSSKRAVSQANSVVGDTLVDTRIAGLAVN